jgi:leader peptidase (prepilin peptidase)/N-methyltransferase
MTIAAIREAGLLPLPLILLCVAPFIGSFLGVLVVRLAAARPVLWGRSTCDACGCKLGASDLVPLVSWAASGGRCRHCGGRISPFYPLVELAAAGVVLWAATETSGVVLVASCALGWTLLALALIDWRAFLLPDALTAWLALSGAVVAYTLDRANFFDHVLGAAVGFLLFAAIALIYRALRGRVGLGLGDAKLLAGAGAWLTWQALPSIVLWGAAIGLVYVLARAVAGQSLRATDPIPFGTFLAAAAWLVWLYGPLASA